MLQIVDNLLITLFNIMVNIASYSSMFVYQLATNTFVIMNPVELNSLRWRNYHKLDYPLEESLNYFHRYDLLINESLRLRILETLYSLQELRNELYRQIRSGVKLTPIQRKMF